MSKDNYSTTEIYEHDLKQMMNGSLLDMSKKELLKWIVSHRDCTTCIFCVIYQKAMVLTYLNKKEE